MKRVLLQPAYVLHRRPYRETSFLIEVITPDHGRLSLLARGARKARSSSPGLLQPFVPLLISWSGNSELKTLAHIDTNGEAKRLQGECLFAGFYLNELMISLLEKWDPHPALYQAYEKAITNLQSTTLQPSILRAFEKHLLEELGYGLLPKSDVSLQNSILPDKFYRFIPEQGFVLSEMGDLTQSKTNVFLGKNLLAIAREDWQDEVLQDAKRLTRLVLTPLLGAKPIHSRQLFMQPNEEKQTSDE